MRILPTIALGAQALLLATVTQAQDDDTADAAAMELPLVKVQAARTGQVETSLPYTVTIIDRAEIDAQLSLGHDIAQIIGNVVPAYSPSRQKMSGFGETLRGRSPLILIDGIPQSTPLRDGSRDTYVIDPDMVERIEVLHGANAIQGTGATGGIINFVTRTASPGQPLETAFSLQARANDDFEGDSVSWRAHASAAASAGAFDFLVGASIEETGMFFDAEDRPIAVDNTQGDIMDADGHDLFFKAGYSHGAQRLAFTFNQFEFGGNGGWVTVPGSVADGTPATSVPGVVEGAPAENDVRNVALDYRHDALGAGRLEVQLYRQSIDAIYGGGVFGVFQDPTFGDDLFDQSRNRSDKTGAKLTYQWPGLARGDVDLAFGVDYLEDTTEQDLVQTGRSWVPETSYVNWAPFVQADWRLGALTLSGGLRHENAELDVGDFTTLAGYGSVFVAGGSPDFEETLVNFGANWRLAEGLTLFGVHSEGFTMPDVGRVLRGITTPGLEVDAFLDLQPVLADNTELGIEWRGETGQLRLSRWQSDSDLGARLFADADGIFSVGRQKTEIDGWELAGELNLGDDTRLVAAYSKMDGLYDSDDDGAVDSDLDGTNVAPDRLNLAWEQQWSRAWGSRLQASHFYSRDFDTRGVTTTAFDGFTLYDLLIDWRLGARHRLTLSLENLADEQYITYYSQSYAAAGDARYFAGRGRQIGLTWRTGF